MFEDKRRRKITVSTNPEAAKRVSRGMNIEMSAAHKPPRQLRRSKYIVDSVLDPMEKRLGRFAVKRLILVIVVGMALVCALRLAGYLGIKKAAVINDSLSFDREKIVQGQVWRLLTFVFIPDNIHILFVALELYLYNMFGTALEREWGSFRFDIYYLLGVICCITAGFITGYTTNTYLNLTLFLAYALFFPNKSMLLFFILPVKVKWLALIDALFMLAAFVLGGINIKVVIFFSVLNLLLFFGQDMYGIACSALKRRRRSKNKKI